MSKSTTLGLLVAIAALAGLAVDTWSNAVAIGGGKVRFDDTTAYVIAIAGLGAFAGLSFPLAFKHNKTAGAILALGWCFGLVFSIGASIDRVGGAKDSAVHAGASVNARIERLDQRIARYERQIAWEIAGRPMRNGKPDMQGRRTGRTGCGTQCKVWQAKLEAAESRRTKHGIIKEADPGGARIEALTIGTIEARHWRTFHPVIGVIALTCLFNGLLLLAGAMLASAVNSTPPKIVDVNVRTTNSVLAVLRRQRGWVTNRQLAELADLSEATTHREVKKLHTAGLVIKERAGRARQIRLA